MKIKNGIMKTYPFLKIMYEDAWYPNIVVDMGKALLIELCLEIEEKQPKDLVALYKITHIATNKFNDLEAEFYKEW